MWVTPKTPEIYQSHKHEYHTEFMSLSTVLLYALSSATQARRVFRGGKIHLAWVSGNIVQPEITVFV